MIRHSTDSYLMDEHTSPTAKIRVIWVHRYRFVDSDGFSPAKGTRRTYRSKYWAATTCGIIVAKPFQGNVSQDRVEAAAILFHFLEPPRIATVTVPFARRDSAVTRSVAKIRWTPRAVGFIGYVITSVVIVPKYFDAIVELF